MTCIKCEGLMLLHYDEYVCSNCGHAKRKQTYYRNTTVRRQVEETKKRNEVKQQHVQINMKHTDKQYYAKKAKVQDLVKQYGINGTARMLDMPRSSVGLLAKGVSPKRWNRGKFGRVFKLKVARYAIKAKNNYYTAKKFGVSRGAVQNWVREYKQHEGMEWAL